MAGVDWAAVREEQALRDAWERLDKDDPARSPEPPRRAQDWGVRHVMSAVDDLATWLESSVGKAWTSNAYFLTGQAGSGKTHLFLDATLKALEAGRPAVFLPGAAFQPGGLWVSVADQLGLGNVGSDELLGAMDSAAEASSLAGSRFVIFIDALNETKVDDFWLDQLPRLRAAVAPYPHLALAVSCRDTYVDVVLTDAEAAHYVRRDHPGFAGSEVEATQRYFDHYGLEAPKIPLLVPEFSIPLFLRMYCESLVGAEKVEATGHQGRVVIFDRYLAAKLKTVARRLRPGASSTYELQQTVSTVKSVIDRIVDEIALQGREGLTANRAEAVIRELVAHAVESTKVLGILQDEGILTNERLYLAGGSTVSGVRIVFQAFSDYLILSRRLADLDAPDEALVTWLRDETTWGIREAATIVLPERYGVELIDVLGEGLDESADTDDDSEQLEVGDDYFDNQLHRFLVETLPYRDAGAISQRTIDLLNEAQRVLRREEFYRALFVLAPIPDSRLNGAETFEYLARFSMPQRDADFGKATFYELSDSTSPAARLARWAAAGPYDGYDPRVIELAAIPLLWLMSSSNRYMRDWVTKALVQLLRGHLDVMERLVRRFWPTNDPYVVQRVIVVAYGALLRAAHAQSDPGAKLAKTVIELVFARPVRPDELMLDAARGIVRHAEKTGQITADEALPAQPPYGLTVPGSPPTRKALEDKYGWKDGQAAAESYATIEGSLFGLGDFGRYVVESGIHNFSRYRIGAVYPPRQQRKRRTVRPAWNKFVESLTERQVAALTDAEKDETNVLGVGRSGLELSPEQRELLSASFTYPKIRDDEYPGDRARRWVLRRAISLGWTPALFGETDQMIGGRSSGREGHKAERWGKKYQWMAYHELLARVADNYQPHRSWSERETYGGLHEIIADREIDPSLPPVPFEAFDERRNEDVTAWLPPRITLTPWPMARLDFARYNGALESLLADTETEPTLESVSFVRETTPGSDEPWIVLNANTRQVDPKSPKRWRGLQQVISVNTVFARHDEAVKVLEGLAAAHRNDVAFFGGGGEHTDCCYVAEIGRTGPACSARAEGEEAASIGDVTVRVVSTTENYLWESGLYDCSIEDAARLTLPSTFIQAAAQLTFDPHGPSWVDRDGNPTFVYYNVGEGGSALLVRASFLKQFMADQNLELVVSAWFERRVIDGSWGRELPWTEAWLEGRLDASLFVHPSPIRRLAGHAQEHAD